MSQSISTLLTVLTSVVLLGFLLFSARISADSPEAETVIPDKAQTLIDHFGMQKIPHEGPWFLQTHKSDDLIEGALAERYPSERYAYTAIYAVATRDEFSAMHRLATDELWHFYDGSPSEILLLYPDGTGEVKIFGADVLAGQHAQIMVPRGTWMGARPIGSREEAFTFAANTLSPGFEYEDYEIGYRDELVEQYPEFKKQIHELTREDSLTRPSQSNVKKPSPPAISVEELVGRNTAQKTDHISVARFVMSPDTKSPVSLNKQGAEIVLVTHGTGFAIVGDVKTALKRGSVIYMPAQVPHQIVSESRLELFAVSSPAYQPENNILVNP